MAFSVMDGLLSKEKGKEEEHSRTLRKGVTEGLSDCQTNFSVVFASLKKTMCTLGNYSMAP